MDWKQDRLQCWCRRLQNFPVPCILDVENKRVNAKSIMGVMSLGLLNGDSITIETNGEDEVGALEEIEKFLAGK